MFYDNGESVEGYYWQKRHMVEGHYAEGKYPEDVASPAEKEAGVLNVLKPADERDDMDVFSVEKAFEKHDSAPSGASRRARSSSPTRRF